MIDGPPQVVGLTVDLHVDLVDVPAPVAKGAHAAHPLPADIGREHRPKSIPPEPHRLVAQVDPALEQQVFHIA